MEPLKQIKNVKTGTKIINYVPYQKCPICNGSGIIIQTVFNSTVTYTQNTCDVCGGAKIIPMHALIKHLKIEKEEEIPILIKDLKISRRAIHICNNAEVKYLHELCEFSREDLMKFRNMGRKSLNELENAMEDHGLIFKR